MKKFISVTAAGTLLFAASPVSAQETSAETILNDTRAAMDSLESYSLRTEVEGTVYDSEFGDFDYNYQVDQDIIVEPFTLRSDTVSVYDNYEESYRSYWNEEGYFMEQMDGSWIKLFDGLGDFEGANLIAQQYLDEIELYAGDFSVEEEDGYYVLTYDLDGEIIEDYPEPSLNGNGNGDELDLSEDAVEDFEVTALSYEIYIDQETGYLTDYYSDFTTEITYADGESLTIEESEYTQFHNFNSVESFEVPAEVIKEAEEGLVDEDTTEEGDELPATSTSYPAYTFIGLLLFGAGALFLFRRPEKTVS
jgi:LPXTG-motif cell wall-anchored protein